LLEADKRKDEFLATLAHELRNPLAPIRNGLDLLKLSDASSSLPKVREIMERQLDLMVRLVDDLLEVSRITSGKIHLRKQRTDVSAVMLSAVETTRPVIEASGHQLALTLPPQPLTVEADPVRLAQVLANLLNNAAKYTDRGGHIALSAINEGGEAVVSVRDDGNGIPNDMLQNVFNLFTQVNRTYDRAQGGLGIGLTLVRRLVELHDGNVEARSDGVGKGSEFIVKLPLVRGNAELPAHKTEQNIDALRQGRILIVDDNQDAADSQKLLLQSLGATVMSVNDGFAALDALKTWRPTVVLLDVGMPVMDGYEVARRIRRETEGRDMILIAVTGWGQEQDRLRSAEAGMDHHLVKPVDIYALEGLLASMQSHSRH
jgi:CheY-like chemotaxis protein/two-component sensor histidine kinase